MSQNGSAYRSHAQFFDNPLCNKNKKAAENQLLFAYRVELEELEPLVSCRIIKYQNRLFTRVLRFRAFGEIPRNTIK